MSTVLADLLPSQWFFYACPRCKLEWLDRYDIDSHGMGKKCPACGERDPVMFVPDVAREEG